MNLYKVLLITKDQLRNFYQKKRNLLCNFQVKQAKRIVKQKLVANINCNQSAHIGFYAAYKNEVDVSLFLEFCLLTKKNCYFPICKGDDLFFAKIDFLTQWGKNKFGILEPIYKELITILDLDCVLLPGVACDFQGVRLGSGFGFYDRALNQADKKPYLISILYRFQLCDVVPKNPWDVMVDELCIVD